MKCKRVLWPVSVCFSVLIYSLLFSSCRDEAPLTVPFAPSLDVVDQEVTSDLERISYLITALFPSPGLSNAADTHWRNIRRSWEGGNESAARAQVIGFVNQALDLLAEEQLLDPTPDMGLPESTEGVLAELVMRLYAFVGLSSLDATEDFGEFFDAVFDAQDSGFGVIDPETGGVVTSANGWSRVTALPGSTGETVFIQIQLLDQPTCETASGLTQALGCWDIDRYPAGDFLQDVTVEICVADPGENVMTDYEYYVAQRLHKQDETTQEITVLPLVNSTLDCTDFPLGQEPTGTVTADGGRSLLGSLGSSIAAFFLPDPLAAHLQELRRPPRGLGGLVGSFTWFFGAVPEEPAYERLPVGSGPAASWVVEEPAEDVELCNAEGGAGCPEGSVTEVEVAAVAQGTTADEGPPWWRVYLFYRPSDQSEPPTLIGQGDYAGYTDNGSDRYYRWVATLQGDGLPEGLANIYAVGVRLPKDGGHIFGTGLVSYVTVIPPLECATQSEIPQTECEALVALYASTTGDEWIDNTNWLDYSNICGWYGVTCEGGVVTRLELQYNGLTGTLPPQVGDFGDLVFLYLFHNQLSGTIPSDLGALGNLERLMLSSNQLSGPIPASLGNLEELQYLWLYENQLTGSIPATLGNLEQLIQLWLQDNQLTGSVPQALGNLSSLLYLDLHKNHLAGTIPPELGGLTQLLHLYLYDNEFSGPIPHEFGNLGNLKVMWLQRNDLEGPIPPELANLSNLERLDLSSNQLVGPIPEALGDVRSLTTLALEFNQLQGPIPPELGNLEGLQDLQLGYNSFESPIPPELGQLESLRYLYIAGGQLNGSIPPELGDLSTLEALNLSGNQLSGPIPVELGGLSNLNYMDLGGNQLNGSIPAEFASLVKLGSLGLGHNQLTGSIPAGLADLTGLRWLDLSENGLSGAVPLEVASLSGASSMLACYFVPGNPDLYLPDTPEYRAADQDGDGFICGLGFTGIGLTLPSLAESVAFEDLIQR